MKFLYKKISIYFQKITTSQVWDARHKWFNARTLHTFLKNIIEFVLSKKAYKYNVALKYQFKKKDLIIFSEIVFLSVL